MVSISKIEPGRVALAFVLFALIYRQHAMAQHLVVSNPLPEDRTPEVITLPLAEVQRHMKDIEHLTAEDSTTHQILPTEIYRPSSDSSQDVLLITVQLKAHTKLDIDFVPSPQSQDATPLVFGRDAPERKDDFAWENQYVAYRVYGPALEATGEITSGIDVWSKRVPNLVIDRFYKHDAEGARTHNSALSYHKDDGVGLDSYLVGPTRGCGGTGVFSGDKLWVSKNYTHLKMLSSGPVRFAFELTYAPWDANGVQVTETKRISLDAGARMNRIESTFTFAGTGTIDAAAGLAIHKDANYEQIAGGRILSVWDTPQDASAGRITTGMIAASSEHARAIQSAGQGLLLFPVHSGQTFTYYAGSGWSKADMPTQQAWDQYLSQVLKDNEHPLRLEWVKSKR